MKPIVIIKQESNNRRSLASYIHVSMDFACMCELQDKLGFIDMREPNSTPIYYDKYKFLEIPNMWNWYFTQPMINIELLEIDNYPTYLCSDSIVAPSDCVSVGPNNELRSIFYKKYLHFNQDVINQCNQLLKKYKLDLSNTISITFRGTDKWVEAPPCPIEKYFSTIDTLIEKFPSMKIFVSGDEWESVNSIKLRYPNVITIDEFFLPPKQPAMIDHINQNRGYYKGLQCVLLILILSTSKFLIGNTSNIFHISRLLSNSKVYYMHNNEKPTVYDNIGS